MEPPYTIECNLKIKLRQLYLSFFNEETPIDRLRKIRDTQKLSKTFLGIWTTKNGFAAFIIDCSNGNWIGGIILNEKLEWVSSFWDADGNSFIPEFSLLEKIRDEEC